MARKISVFDYMDYRLFLRDYYKMQKENTRYFSYRYFSNKAGFSSHNVLKQVIAGDRNIARKSIPKFCRALNLSSRECDFFRLLVLFNQSKSTEEKNDIFQEMFRFKQASKARKITELQYKMYSEWYHSAVREVLSFGRFGDDYNEIAAILTPEVTPAQVKRSIHLLEEIGMIHKNDKGLWELKDPAVKTDAEVESLAIRNYNLKMIDLGAEAVERIPREYREVSSMTLGLSKKMYLHLKEKIQNFKDEVLCDVLADNTDSEEVYQLNFQFFPLLKKAEKAGGEE